MPLHYLRAGKGDLRKVEIQHLHPLKLLSIEPKLVPKTIGLHILKCFTVKTPAQVLQYQPLVNMSKLSLLCSTSTVLPLALDTEAVYQWLNPPPYENFNPGEANPDMEIHCVGTKSQIQLPVLNPGRPTEFGPNVLTIQELCAKSQYGGSPGYHIGGYCMYKNPSLPGPRVPRNNLVVEFDAELPDSGANRQLSFLLLMAECRLRCYCLEYLTYAPPRPIARRMPSDQTIELTLDSTDVRRNVTGALGSRAVLATFMYRGVLQWKMQRYLAGFSQENLMQGPGPWLGRERYASLNSANYIQCGGAPPAFPTYDIPPPTFLFRQVGYDGLRVHPNHALSAVQLGSGDGLVSL